jgi:CMP-N-acetylneuraminic acid synthetase
MEVAMDVIIPAKAVSNRVPGKNWREFHDGLCLVDITIQKVLASGVPGGSIHVSSEDHAMARYVCERWGVHFLPRPPAMSDNAFPLTDWIRGITAQVPGDGDIAWAQVCDPLFDEYGEIFECWREGEYPHNDSLVVCRPWKGYLMTENQQPVGWSFGEHHTPSQKLPQFYTMPFTLSILTREAIRRTGYHVGTKPYWWVAEGPHVDIDTEFDFAVAQAMFARTQRPESP